MSFKSRSYFMRIFNAICWEEKTVDYWDLDYAIIQMVRTWVPKILESSSKDNDWYASVKELWEVADSIVKQKSMCWKDAAKARERFVQLLAKNFNHLWL